MKSKRTILLILIIIASMIPEVRAITPQSQTVKITDTHDDGFITEVGIGIDSSLVTIKDPNMDIRSYLVFRELDINYWEPLKNATLRLHTSNTLSFDADSSITIYGMALSDLQLEGYLIPSTVLSIGFTSAHTDYNTSEFYGNQWHEINVTDIIEELIRNANWDGDGHAGTETGDAIGFHIVGAEGDDKRYFYDYSIGNGLEAQLIIHWNHEPPPPAGYPDATYNGTYRGYDIFYQIITQWVNYTDWPETDASNKIDVFNSSYVHLGDLFYASSNARLGGIEHPDDFYTTGGWKFGILIDVVSDQADNARPLAVFHGLGEPDELAGVKSYDGGDKNYTGFAIFEDEDQADGKFVFGIETWQGGANYYAMEPVYRSVSATRWYWVNVTYNCPLQNYRVEIYNDSAMTILDSVVERVGYQRIDPEGYSWEFIIHSELQTYSGYFEGALRSYPELGADMAWIVTDENGTIIGEVLDDYEDALIVIDEVLGADPEDPNPPGQGWDETGPFTRFRTRLYIFMMGFGLLFGPLVYFAIRRPSGYEFVIGLFIMLVGYSFLRAAAGI